jgi:segregation and condensation protein B
VFGFRKDEPLFAAEGPGRVSMNAFQADTGRLLHSVSLRYRQRFGMPRMPHGAKGNTYPWLALPPREQDPPIKVGPHARDQRMARLEAVLLLSQQPQSSRKLAQLTGLADGTKARTLVRKLNRLYDMDGSAFRVEEVGGGFQLMTRPKFAPWLRRLHLTNAHVGLSAPALETLAVIAYRQPVLRAEIEAIRGVQCGEILRQLIERNVVRIIGRSGELGRPILYGTTKLFLQVFGLRHVDDLPRAELLRRSKLGDVKTQADKE